jgi:hypothetical protein
LVRVHQTQVAAELTAGPEPKVAVVQVMINPMHPRNNAIAQRPDPLAKRR